MYFSYVSGSKKSQQLLEYKKLKNQQFFELVERKAANVRGFKVLILSFFVCIFIKILNFVDEILEKYFVSLQLTKS